MIDERAALIDIGNGVTGDCVIEAELDERKGIESAFERDDDVEFADGFGVEHGHFAGVLFDVSARGFGDLVDVSGVAREVTAVAEGDDESRRDGEVLTGEFRMLPFGLEADVEFFADVERKAARFPIIGLFEPGLCAGDEVGEIGRGSLRGRFLLDGLLDVVVGSDAAACGDVFDGFMEVEFDVPAVSFADDVEDIAAEAAAEAFEFVVAEFRDASAVVAGARAAEGADDALAGCIGWEEVAPLGAHL